MNKPENFLIPSSFIDTIDLNELHATFEAMVECELDRAPFEQLAITVPENTVIKVTKDGQDANPQPEMGLMEFSFKGLNGRISTKPGFEMRVLGWKGKQYINYFEALPKILSDSLEQVQSFKQNLTEVGQTYLKVLIVALATRAIRKDRKQNKLAKLGIGKGLASRHSYTTTIYAPSPEDCGNEPGHSGTTLRPHLRRGHVRRQHYGPSNEWVKKIFVEAVFVNSDKDFVSFRDHYNVSIKQGVTQ